MTLPILSIIIVNWNSAHQLRDCLSSIAIAKQDAFTIAEVVVVDNGSTDNSLDGIDQLGVPVHLILNIENRGFAAACNQGAAVASGGYFLFLNPDTRLFDNSLAVPLAFMQDQMNQNVGIVGIQLIDEQNRIARSCARFPSLGIFAAQAFGVNRLPKLRHLTQAMVEWRHDSIQTVDQVIGAFYIIRHSLFAALGGFDERFFVYFEEVDLSFRAQQAGFRSVYLSDAQAFHAGGGTSRQVKAHRLFYSLRSRLLYGFKHFSPWQAWGLVLVTLGVEPISRTLFSLVGSGLKGVRNTWRAYGMLWRDMRYILEKNKY